MNKNNATLKLLCLVAIAVFAASCGGKSNQPNFELMPSLSMMDQKSLKAGKEEKFFENGAAMRMPPAGTIPKGYYPYTKDKYTPADEAGRGITNPLPRSQAVLARGAKMYNTYCIVCHGVKGKGDGTIIPKFPMPPTLHSEKVRNWSDGSVYHVITAGQNLMPSYATQIDESDRWAIVHYVRALQLAVNP